ncbi:hypothetical protein FNV43_RR14044 [Rhamnella rubrinervis]|uniref:Uncharacterized protein n=1 Tax=Rhamnella rubrinervis TaxID=2594499 RepID=A0A8K0MG20_9ROSA|nr:hypothetical protein FNV43_RR14044 [Rhamnella rubrinervis]
MKVKMRRNKTKIVEAGALEPIISFLKSHSSNLQEYATASLLTLSASVINKPLISASGAIPLLVEILRYGSSQAKVDALKALSNLSTGRGARKWVPPSREIAVGALLTMCQSDRCKYREPILKEGVIPGLLELTVQGTPKSQSKVQTLLRLLRDSPYPRSELEPDTVENIVCNIISQIDGDDQSGKAKKMLADMVQVSMEQSLRHLQQRALVCTPSDLPINSCTSEVSLK